MHNLLTRLTGQPADVIEREVRNFVAALVIGMWIVAVVWAFVMGLGTLICAATLLLLCAAAQFYERGL
jgi:hypothetical protein